MKKILIAYDGGEPAHRALDMAADLATRYEAEVGVVSVVPFHGGRSPIDPWDDGFVHSEELDEARDLLLERGIEPRLFEPAGEPAAMIEHIAQTGDYDVVVVGSRGLGALSRFLQGSVSEHVATHTAATVIVTR
ncbi:MAG TPA: universal stress protein [Candidatus Limnocylindrales bacterium]|jgi:nucleotide-binding universal stress UspA family protein|nr:universal stress protein [Candidatus Limnocylindrales bacterium]